MILTVSGGIYPNPRDELTIARATGMDEGSQSVLGPGLKTLGSS